MLDDTKERQAPDSESVPPEGGQPDTPPPAPTSTVNSDDGGAVDEEAYGYERYEPSEDDPYHGEPYESPAAATPENHGSSQPEQSLVQQSVEAPGLAGHQQTIDVRPETSNAVTKSSQPPPPPPPPSTPDDEEEDDEEEGGMLRMSFMEHLEELRGRILKALVGVGVAFVVCLLVRRSALANRFRAGHHCAETPPLQPATGRHQPDGAVFHHLGEDAFAGLALRRLTVGALPGLGLYFARTLQA